MNSLAIERFRHVLLPLNPVVPGHNHLYLEAFKCWKGVWDGIYKKFELGIPLFSDGFTRQTEASCIFYDQTCIGLTLYRRIDFGLFPYATDSYYFEWSERDLEIMLRHGTRVFIASFLTVLPEFRNFHRDLKFKAVFMNLMVRRFLEYKDDSCVMTTRRDRDVNGESFKTGATLIRENVPYMRGRDYVDFVCIYRKDAHLSQQPAVVQDFCQSLTQNRLDLTLQPFSARDIKAA